MGLLVRDAAGRGKPRAYPAALAVLLWAAPAAGEPLPWPDGFAAAFRQGDLTIAAAIIRPVAQACEAQQATDDRCVTLFLGAAMVDLMLAESLGGRETQAARSVPRAAAALRLHAAADPESLGIAGQMLGRLRMLEWRYGEAEDAFRAAHAAYLRAVPQDVQAIASALGNVAHAVAAQGREGEATPLYREVLAILRRQEPADPLALLAALSSLATSLDNSGRSDMAEPVFREALALAVAQYGEGGPGTVRHVANLAVNLERLGRLAAAESLFRNVLAIREEEGEPDRIQAVRLHLAANLYAQRRHDEAEGLAAGPYALASGREPGDPARVAATQQLGLIWSWLPPRRAGARMLLREALLAALAQAGERPGFDAEARFRLAAAQPVVRRSVAVAWALAHP